MQTGEQTVVSGFLPQHRDLIAQLLVHIGWDQPYIDGQLGAIEQLAGDAKNGRVLVAHYEAVFAGYISVQFHRWNRLAQFHGLVVEPSMRRRSIAARLVERAEAFVKEQGGRGIYVDTPVNNVGAREFYTRQHYRQDYLMTAYYDVDLDGVTYLKLF